MTCGKRRVGIYLDIGNIEFSLADYNCTGMALDYSEMIRQLSGDDEIVILRGYDCEVDEACREKEIQATLGSIGVEMVLSEPCKERTLGTAYYRAVQKEVDTGITTDVSWDLATGRIDRAVIVSGDRDMRPALKRAILEGKEVTIACVRSSIGDKYASEIPDCVYLDDCDIFLLAGEDRDEVMINTASFAIAREAVAE